MLIVATVLGVVLFSHPLVAVPVNLSKRIDDSTIAHLAPPLGHKSGVNPDGTGNCDGAVVGPNGKPIQIPCSCPPSQDEYISQLQANVHAGFAIHNPTVQISFPTDNSTESQLARITAATITVQNLKGAGVGCPASSTTFGAQRKAIAAGQPSAVAPAASSITVAASPPTKTGASCSTPASPPPPSAATPASSSASGVSNSTIAALAPPLGFAAGKNPDGAGNCDGAVNGTNGQPIKIPCSCPPPNDEYISQLIANVDAGFAIHNPSVKVIFPTDNSTESRHARITAASITIQNLNGPGVGCPIVSTTLRAQDKAIQG